MLQYDYIQVIRSQYEVQALFECWADIQVLEIKMKVQTLKLFEQFALE